MTDADPICRRCNEPVRRWDRRSPFHVDGLFIHYECGVRMVVGSVGHLQGKCSCYGGTDEDPTGMTEREAARAACDLWMRQSMERQVADDAKTTDPDREA